MTRLTGRSTALAPLYPLAALCCGTLLALASACTSEAGDPGLSESAQRGKGVYLNVCVACHNANPAVDGSVGPAVAGASEALLRDKVLNGEYPPGYTPKRPGGVTMPKFPYLAEQIPALTAYLAEAAQTPASK